MLKPEEYKLCKLILLLNNKTLRISLLGNKRNYDDCAELTGDEGWSYNEMLKYFEKRESFDATLVDADPKYHNFDGPVRIANAPYRAVLADAFVQASVEMGLPPVDYNGGEQTGFSYL